jgi:hypothetical protein
MTVSEMGEIMQAMQMVQDPERFKKILKDHWNCPEFEQLLLRLARLFNEAIEHDKTCNRFLRF